MICSAVYAWSLQRPDMPAHQVKLCNPKLLRCCSHCGWQSNAHHMMQGQGLCCQHLHILLIAACIQQHAETCALGHWDTQDPCLASPSCRAPCCRDRDRQMQGAERWGNRGSHSRSSGTPGAQSGQGSPRPSWSRPQRSIPRPCAPRPQRQSCTAAQQGHTSAADMLLTPYAS